MSSAPEVGDLAPDFTLPGTSPETGDQQFTLSATRGRPLVLAFYPGDETPVCTRQLCSYQSDLDVLAAFDAQLWGISSQDLDSHRRFQARRGLTFPLLADVDNTVFGAYGLGSVLNRRAVFVVGADGRIAWKHVSTTGITYRKADEIATALRALPAYPAEPRKASDVAPRPGRRKPSGS
jgi:peroxiredoxin Q/BCP